ncbi:hypothetical protein PASE110613_08585 [Paenibacillus sediminis]|uniref:Uncharacterized protein n=1 Tax=Paenibacillus sediminis TaxID=664909 RepID=A0ABS4H232_9BACL|nr:hypothetical protein [Paenibacillus sediminis]MBP1936598.1 hypothetical protein [Paenibacillus sediminis]
MKKIFIMTLFFLCIMTTNNLSVNADALKDVGVIVNSNEQQYSKQFDASVTVKFKDKNLYNKKVYLSYHVYDFNGKELLWEGQRFPFSIDEHGNGNVEINIDLSSVSQPIQNNYAKVKFDLIDEKNVYWFSTNPKIAFSSDEIILDGRYSKKFIGTLSSAIQNNPVIISANFLCFLLFIFGFFKLKKSEFFYNLE